MTAPRIYLDNAATSWPKPETVYAAVDRYLRESGAPPGRSTYAEANQLNQGVAAARAGIARMIGADDPRRIVFALNGTDALNLAIHGLLTRGGHVVTTVVEHNSVLRPLRGLEESGQIAVTRVSCDDRGVVDAQAIAGAMQKDTVLVAMTHASNVTGALQPVAEVGKHTRERGVTFLVDAAQTLGHLPVNVRDIGADLLAAPGHKGLMGPLGTGLLYVGPGVELRLVSVRQGGTGTQSDDDHHPTALPYKYESGSLNAPGVLGLGAAIDFLRLKGLETIRRHHVALTSRLMAGLADLPGVRIYGPQNAEPRVGVVSITVEGYDPQEVAATLDAVYHIQVRSGIHCAPLAHRALGTAESGGTTRFSIGVFNTESDIDAAIAATAELAAEFSKV
jgi:cysteine desulfurase family protein